MYHSSFIINILFIRVLGFDKQRTFKLTNKKERNKNNEVYNELNLAFVTKLGDSMVDNR